MPLLMSLQLTIVPGADCLLLQLYVLPAQPDQHQVTESEEKGKSRRRKILPSFVPFPCHSDFLYLISSIIIIIIIIIIILTLFSSIIRQRFSGQCRSQQVQAIYPSTSRIMCAVLISVIFCSSMADGWPGSNCRFWSNPFLIVSNVPILNCTVFALTFHNPLTSISRFLFFLSFSVSFVLTFESLMWPYRSVGKSPFFYHAVLYRGGLPVLFDLW